MVTVHRLYMDYAYIDAWDIYIDAGGGREFCGNNCTSEGYEYFNLGRYVNPFTPTPPHPLQVLPTDNVNSTFCLINFR